ncbi:MAG: SsrA-binding protein [Mycoplasmoidaceae bacterium]
MAIVIKNKKAYYNYIFIQKIEAGLELKGTEVKSIIAGNTNIERAFVIFQSNQAYIINMHVAHYDHGNIWNLPIDRKRKILLHKREILQLQQLVKLQNATIIPIKIYFNHGKIKMEIGVAKGKKLYDKREDLKKRDLKRERKNHEW